MKVAIYSAKPFEVESLKKARNSMNHELVYINTYLNEQTSILAQGCTAVSVFSTDEVSEKVLHQLKELGVQYIAARSAGYNHIDVDVAQQLNIKVANVPDYSPYAVAEHTVLLMLALNRKIIQAHQQVQNLNFSLDNLIGFDMNGKIVGIIGLGKIGGVLAKILHGFGCTILGVDIEPNEELIRKYNVHYVDIDFLCSKSDIISLHTPLNQQTHHMINEERINSMKKGVMLINTSRGALLDTKAVIQALKKQHIGYLGLDVYELEKGLFFEDHSEDILQDDVIARLMTFKNVLITSHQGFLTDVALKNRAETTMYNLNCWEKGVDSKYELTTTPIEMLRAN